MCYMRFYRNFLALLEANLRIMSLEFDASIISFHRKLVPTNHQKKIVSFSKIIFIFENDGSAEFSATEVVEVASPSSFMSRGLTVTLAVRKKISPLVTWGHLK